MQLQNKVTHTTRCYNSSVMRNLLYKIVHQSCIQLFLFLLRKIHKMSQFRNIQFAYVSVTILVEKNIELLNVLDNGEGEGGWGTKFMCISFSIHSKISSFSFSYCLVSRIFISSKESAGFIFSLNIFLSKTLETDLHVALMKLTTV